MRKSQALLPRLRYGPQYHFSQVCVDYIDRGAFGDRSLVFGRDIMVLGSSGMDIQSKDDVKHIPFHRVLRIRYQGVTVWERSIAKEGKNSL